MYIMTMKICTKCRTEKPLTPEYFYRRRVAKDGFNSWCKHCSQADYKKSVQTGARRKWQKMYRQTERGKAAVKRYTQSENRKRVAKRHARSEKGRATRKKYIQTESYKLAIRKTTIKRRAQHPDQYKAHTIVNNAVKLGRLAPISTCQCVNCTKQAEFYHHYLGYEPEHVLDVVPMCRKCDREAHKQIA